MTLSGKILAATKQKGVIQEELAAATNLAVHTIQRIENGETTPQFFTIRAMANGYWRHDGQQIVPGPPTTAEYEEQKV